MGRLVPVIWTDEMARTGCPRLAYVDVHVPMKTAITGSAIRITLSRVPMLGECAIRPTPSDPGSVQPMHPPRLDFCCGRCFRVLGDSMSRRGALAVLSSALILGLARSAKAASPVHRIGSLGLGAQPDPADIQAGWASAREFGWIEGQNVVVERRFAAGKPELLKSYAEELVRLDVEVILAFGTPATLAAKNATSRIPIVMITAGDPVRAGLVATLAKPGGNVTGFSILYAELDAKRLGLLRELLPAAQRIGVLVERSSVYRDDSERTYRSVAMQPLIIEVADGTELEHAVDEAVRRRAEALMVALDSLSEPNRSRLMRAALRHGLPTIVADRELVAAGGLLGLAIEATEPYRAFAYFLDKILRGAKPVDLPVQQPTKFVLSINLKTARALGLTIPQSLMLRADEVIQ